MSTLSGILKASHCFAGRNLKDPPKIRHFYPFSMSHKSWKKPIRSNGKQRFSDRSIECMMEPCSLLFITPAKIPALLPLAPYPRRTADSKRHVDLRLLGATTTMPLTRVKFKSGEPSRQYGTLSCFACRPRVRGLLCSVLLCSALPPACCLPLQASVEPIPMAGLSTYLSPYSQRQTSAHTFSTAGSEPI